MTTRRTAILAAIGALAATSAVLTPALAQAGTVSPASAPAGSITVYQGKIVNQDIVLGPQSNPTTLTETVPLPAGRYMITATVGAVISSHDQIVCAAYPGGGNDGVFGTAGNPGTGGIYGTATITDTVKVTNGQRIVLGCNSFNYGLGTYAGSAVLEVVPIGTLH